MIAQHKLKKGAVDAQAAHKVEENELKGKASIKEKEQAKIKNEQDESEPFSVEILEDSHN